MISLSKKELRKILAEIFGILEFSESEIEKTIENFQKRIAFELLESVKEELPVKYREFIDKESKNITDLNHPMVAILRKEINKLRTKKEYLKMGSAILKKLIPGYIDFASRGLSAEKQMALDKFKKKSIIDI